jgi:hypothetical protein
MIFYKNSRSSGMQESFVINITKEKRNGFYVELGSGDPYEESNTSLLEELGWKGLSIDIDQSIVDKFNLSNRTNKSICADALRFNYSDYFYNNEFPKNIDFLQIDIDGHDKGNCLLALLALPMLEYRFSVIIIEHDLIQNHKNVNMRDAQREILSSLGYKLVGQTFSEDWWIDKTTIHEDVYGNYMFIGYPPISDHKEI